MELGAVIKIKALFANSIGTDNDARATGLSK